MLAIIVRTVSIILLVLKILLFISVNTEDISRHIRRESISGLNTPSHGLRHSTNRRRMLAEEIEDSITGNYYSSLAHESLVVTHLSDSKSNAPEDPNNLTGPPPVISDSSTFESCPRDLPCSQLGGDCINCNFNYSCVYGEELIVQCMAKDGVMCQENKNFTRTMKCQYCYQSDASEHSCQKNTTCKVVSAPRQRYIAKCTVHNHVLCLGRRVFSKSLLCNWTRGHSWNTALLLSIVLGGFGVDRFYLGMWQEGIGKLFSFGGLGVWTLVDVILIASGYLGPADGSLYFL